MILKSSCLFMKINDYSKQSERKVHFLGSINHAFHESREIFFGSGNPRTMMVFCGVRCWRVFGLS
jgi:hypothetical protein